MTNNQDLEDKIGIIERLKYVSIPLATTFAAYFGPEIKQKFDSMSGEDKTKYKRIGSTIVSGSIVGALTYFLFPSVNKDNYENDQDMNHNDQS